MDIQLARDWGDHLQRLTLGVDADGKVAPSVSPREPNNWGRWGDLDERGTLNHLTPDRVVAAAQLVTSGRTVSCAIPIGEDMPVHPSRPHVVHTHAITGSDIVAGLVAERDEGGFFGADDFIAMPLQSATHWDGLTHAAFDSTMYNGFWVGNVGSYGGARRLSTHLLTDTLMGRGVLLDLPRAWGVPHLEPGQPITADDLDRCAAGQGVSIGTGDILLVRTGELGWFYSLADKAEYWTGRHAGLSIGTVSWIHEHQVAAIGMDNRTFEVTPFEEPFDVSYPLHSRLIRDLGLTIGELWWLDDLAAACIAEERWEFPLVAPPLNVTNASGAPTAPLACFREASGRFSGPG
jgi:kynurenine formamidase